MIFSRHDRRDRPVFGDEDRLPRPCQPIRPQRPTKDVETVALDLSSPLKVVSWASAHADCPMRYTTTSTGEVVIIFGRGSTEFELSLDGGALRTLARLTAEALVKVDTDADERRGELVTTGERSS